MSEIVTKGGEKLYKAETEKEIDELYRHHDVLAEAGEEASKHNESYKYILDAVRTGQERVKQLACQFIPKFFKYFDKLDSQAINAMLDLCEEESRNIRLTAIKGLPLLCNNKYIKSIANVLCQLLIEEDKVESDVIKNTFIQLFKIDCKAALVSLFEQIESVEQEDPKAREQAIVFLKERVMPMAPELLATNPDAESYISTEIQKLLPTATDKEFADFFTVLRGLSMYQDESGQRLLLKIIADQSPLNKSTFKYDPKDVSTLKKVLNLVHLVAPLLDSLKQNGPFFSFLTNDVLPNIEELSDEMRLDVLRSVSVESASATPADARQVIGTIYQKLIDQIPLKQGETEPALNFSYLECYLYCFHQLARKALGALNPVCGIKIVTGQPGDDLRDYSAKRNDMITRLQYLEQRCNTYRKTLIELLKKNRELAAKAESASETTSTEETAATAETAQSSISNEEAQSTMRIIKNILKLSSALSKKQATFLKPEEFYLSWVEYKGKKRSAPESGDQPAEKRQRTQYNNSSNDQRRSSSGSSSSRGGGPARSTGSSGGGYRGGSSGHQRGGSSRGGGRGGRGRGGFRGGRRNN